MYARFVCVCVCNREWVNKCNKRKDKWNVNRQHTRVFVSQTHCQTAKQQIRSLNFRVASFDLKVWWKSVRSLFSAAPLVTLVTIPHSYTHTHTHREFCFNFIVFPAAYVLNLSLRLWLTVMCCASNVTENVCRLALELDTIIQKKSKTLHFILRLACVA